MTLHVRADLSDFKRLTRDLEKVSGVAVPYGARDALNAIAFEGRKLWQRELKDTFVLRNDWTTRRLIVEKAKGLSLSTLKSVLTSPDAYLLKQEIGGTEDHSVPTGVATGEGRGASPRRKLVRQPNKVGNIALGQRYRRGSRKQRNAIAVRMAAAEGRKFVYLELPKRKGLFRIKGGRRNPELDMVWDTTSKSHVVHPSPTLHLTVKRLEQKIPALMTSALIDQLRRHKVFGY